MSKRLTSLERLQLERRTLELCFRDAEVFLQLNGKRIPRTTFHFSPVLSARTNSVTPCRQIILQTGLGAPKAEGLFSFAFPGNGTCTIALEGSLSERIVQIDEPLAFIKFLHSVGLASAHEVAEAVKGETA